MLHEGPTAEECGISFSIISIVICMIVMDTDFLPLTHTCVCVCVCVCEGGWVEGGGK